METRTDKFVVVMEKEDIGVLDVYGPYDKAEAIRVAREMVAVILESAEEVELGLFAYNNNYWSVCDWSITVTECMEWSESQWKQ